MIRILLLCSTLPLVLSLSACSETHAGEREAFVERVETSLGDLRERLDDVDDRIESASEDARDGLEETRDALAAKAEALGEKLDELQDSSGDAFANLRDEISDGLERLKQDTDRFFDDLG